MAHYFRDPYYPNKMSVISKREYRQNIGVLQINIEKKDEPYYPVCILISRCN